VGLATKGCQPHPHVEGIEVSEFNTFLIQSGATVYRRGFTVWGESQADLLWEGFAIFGVGVGLWFLVLS